MLKSALTSVALLVVSSSGHASESTDKAMMLLKKATTTLQSAKSISVRAVATTDEIEPTEEFKLQKSFIIDMKFERPNRLYARRIGAENQVAYFDGQSFTVVDPVSKRYGQMPLDGTVDDLLTKLTEINVEAPLLDLLQSNIADVAAKAVIKAKYIGATRVGAKVCEHVAFRTAAADWQLWISQDDKGTLCKSLITTRALAQAPQYEVTFGKWTFDTDINDAMFTAKIPGGSEQVTLAPGSFNTTL